MQLDKSFLTSCRYGVSVSFTLSLRMAGFSPQNGRVGKPGFGGLLSGPGRGVIVMPPVSKNLIMVMEKKPNLKHTA